ncbi:MAG: FtsQ-type POTRA domain-containing protein [Caldilineaceae bacterium]
MPPKMTSGGRDRTRPQTTAARSAASNRQAQQRRRAQRRREFAQQWQRVESVAGGVRSWLPAFDLRQVRLRFPGFSGFNLSKLVSLLMLVGVVAALYTFQEDESFFVYRENVEFVNTGYLTNEDLYEYCDIESWSVLWIDPEMIRQQVLAHPYVADAQVQVQWPAHVTIAVEEVEPIARWSTTDADYWVLTDSRILLQRTDAFAPRVTILDPEAAAGEPGAKGALQLEPSLLETALTLAERLPGLDSLRYNRTHGINFGVPDTQTWIYWGDGRRFDEKWLALQSALPDIEDDRNANQTFSVIAPNRPFFRYYADSPND